MIARIALGVETGIFVGALSDFLGQRQLGPPKTVHSPNVPHLLLECQISFQDDYVLGPADHHGLRHDLWGAFIDVIKVPHPAQVPGREPSGVRIRAMQIFRGGHSRAFFRSAIDQTANLTIEFHLGQSRRCQCVQRGKHNAVVDGFSDVHGSLLSGAARLNYIERAKRNTGGIPCFSLLSAARYRTTEPLLSARSPCRPGGRPGSCPPTVPSPYPPAGGSRSHPTG